MTLPPWLGATVAWSLLLAYVATGSSVIGGFYHFANLLLRDATGHEISAVLLVLIGTGISVWIAWRDVKISARLMLWMEAASVAVIVIVVALVLVRELGPVLAALMVTARAGSAMAAELGSMQATEQIDALAVMAINPIQYLVSPRVIAGIISFPLLTSIFDVIGIWGGYLIGVGLMGAPGGSYLNGIAQNMSGHDIMSGLYKALVFGLVVMWVCCYKGYHAQRMATGVSRATTEAVVLSSVLILAWDYFLTSILL